MSRLMVKSKHAVAERLSPGILFKSKKSPTRRTNTFLDDDTIMNDEAAYICDSCGEEIVVPLDLSAGESQEYVEDCPVCCRANVIHVQIEENGEARVWAAAEQD